MKNIGETLIGFIVVVVAIYFFFFAYKGSNIETVDGYTLNVDFERMDGISVGSDVRVSGLKIGNVVDAEIDTENYRAKVKLLLENNIKLPNDSSAEIISGGLLGDKYVSLVPGGSEEFYKDGDKIMFSQPSISLEALIGKFIFGSASEDKEQKKDEKKSDFFE